MKKNWFKANSTVKNPAQAGDAALMLHYSTPKEVLGIKLPPPEVVVHTQEGFNFNLIHERYHKGRMSYLFLWGVTKGIVKIPLIDES